MLTIWDALPINEAPPFGATVVVVRNGKEGLEVLMLHRAHKGPGYAGDWAWTPPAGARLPGEPIEDCARRELWEETGLDLSLRATACGTTDWWVYLAEAPPDAVVRIDAEHDRFEWVAARLASERCTPDQARLPLVAALAQIPRR